MIARHVHHALRQVRQLRELILAKRLFRGYSGLARMAGGLLALAGAAVMARPDFPAAPTAHLRGWSAVLAAALLCNYGALLCWFIIRPGGRRPLRELIPASDALPALAAGAGLSLALVTHGAYDLLFGAWMCLYGLVHMSYRNSLPFANYLVGLFYLAAGLVMLVWPGVSFTAPCPMGLVFGLGELSGGFILFRLNHENNLEMQEDIQYANRH